MHSNCLTEKQLAETSEALATIGVLLARLMHNLFLGIDVSSTSPSTWEAARSLGWVENNEPGEGEGRSEFQAFLETSGRQGRGFGRDLEMARIADGARLDGADIPSSASRRVVPRLSPRIIGDATKRFRRADGLACFAL